MAELVHGNERHETASTISELDGGPHAARAVSARERSGRREAMARGRAL